MYQTRGQFAHLPRVALADARDAHPRPLVITGARGAGKSYHLRHLVESAEDFRVVSARADLVDRSVPLATLRVAFAPMIDAGRTVGRPTADLLREAFALGWTTDRRNRVLSRDLFHRALLSLSDASPVLVAIDDLHVADVQSSAVIVHLIRHLRGHRVLVAVATRPAPELGPETAATLDRFADHGEVEHINLGAMDDDCLHHMIAAASGQRVSDRLASRVARWSGNNPLLAMMFMEAARESAAIAVVDGELDMMPASSVHLSRHARDIVVDGLPFADDDAKRLAVVASAFGIISLDQLPRLAELARLPLDRAELAFDGLLTCGILSAFDDHFGFAATIVRVALFEQIGPARRRQLQSDRSASLAVDDGVGSSTPSDDLTGSLEDPLQTCETLAHANRHRDAAELATQVARTDRDTARRIVACELGVRELRAIGRLDEAAKLVEELLADPATRTPATLLLRSHIALHQERPMDVLQQLDAARQAGLGADDVIARSLETRAHVAAGRIREADVLAQRLESGLQRFSATERSSAVAALMTAAAVHGDPQRVQVLSDLSPTPDALDDELESLVAWAHYRSGQWDAAERLADRVVARADQDDREPDPVAVSVLIAIRAERGDFHEAENLTRRAADFANRYTSIQWASALLALYRGQDTAALRMVRRTIDDVRANEFCGALPMLLGLEAQAASRVGEHAAARRASDELTRLATEQPCVATTMAALLTRARLDDDDQTATAASQHASQFGLVVDAATSVAILGAINHDSTLLASAHHDLGDRDATVRQRDVTRHLRLLGRRVPGLRTAGAQLTAAEMEIASMVGLGMTNRQIASESKLSVKTIETYMTRIFVKTACTSRTELAILVSNGSVRTSRA